MTADREVPEWLAKIRLRSIQGGQMLDLARAILERDTQPEPPDALALAKAVLEFVHAANNDLCAIRLNIEVAMDFVEEQDANGSSAANAALADALSALTSLHSLLAEGPR